MSTVAKETKKPVFDSDTEGEELLLKKTSLKTKETKSEPKMAEPFDGVGDAGDFGFLVLGKETLDLLNLEEDDDFRTRTMWESAKQDRVYVVSWKYSVKGETNVELFTTEDLARNIANKLIGYGYKEVSMHEKVKFMGHYTNWARDIEWGNETIESINL
ncbi:MAG: hypothetical protein PHX34_04425 [Candidatus Shapirobacteria bacterium]|nr:hypothetical protein [Candidatus Shapirobacteria bacterium]